MKSGENKKQFQSTVFTLSSFPKWLKKMRRSKVRIVATNGCFDILHYGHVQYLERAKRLGDVLVVGLNSDASVRRLKGPERPLVSQKYRAAVLSALSCVDAVVVFPQTLADQFLAVVKPDIYVKGGDYKTENMNPKELGVLNTLHTQIRILPFVKGFSTTSFIKKIRSGKITDL